MSRLKENEARGSAQVSERDRWPRGGDERIGDGFPLGDIVETDVAEGLVGHILDEQPAKSEDALPLVLSPDGRGGVVVDFGEHLGDSGEVTGRVNREEEVDGLQRTSRVSARRRERRSKNDRGLTITAADSLNALSSRLFPNVVELQISNLSDFATSSSVYDLMTKKRA